MNVVLWILQALLALAFLAHGIMFLVPPADIAILMNASMPRWFQLFLGMAEVLAAVGLTIPGFTRIRPQLIPAAAVGVMIVCLSATIWHVVRAEYSSAVTTCILLALATFVAHGRWRRLPITPR